MVGYDGVQLIKGDAAYLDIMVRPGTFIHDDEPKSIEAKFNITKYDPGSVFKWL